MLMQVTVACVLPSNFRKSCQDFAAPVQRSPTVDGSTGATPFLMQREICSAIDMLVTRAENASRAATEYFVDVSAEPDHGFRAVGDIALPHHRAGCGRGAARDREQRAPRGRNRREHLLTVHAGRLHDADDAVQGLRSP